MNPENLTGSRTNTEPHMRWWLDACSCVLQLAASAHITCPRSLAQQISAFWWPMAAQAWFVSEHIERATRHGCVSDLVSEAGSPGSLSVPVPQGITDSSSPVPKDLNGITCLEVLRSCGQALWHWMTVKCSHQCISFSFSGINN